jgi:hypothetical protein
MAHPTSSMGTRVPFRGNTGRGVKSVAHLGLVPRLRMSDAIPALLYLSSWRRQATFYIYTHTQDDDLRN